MGIKKQHILVLLQHADLSETAVLYAFKLAGIHNAEVAFLHLKMNGKMLSDELIQGYNSNDIPYKFVEFGNPKYEPNNIIKQLDVIFMLTQFSKEQISNPFQRNPIFKILEDAKVPTIVVSENTHANCDFKNIIIPVDHKAETKEKMIWASYFGRFNNAVIHLIAPNEKSELIKRKVDATLLFTKKLYEQFNFEYKIVKAESSSLSIKKEAFKISRSFNSDLIVLLSNKNSLLSSYFGPKEIKRYLRKEKNPLLIINPLKDYYLPCR
jgi:hypothetical protein